MRLTPRAMGFFTRDKLEKENADLKKVNEELTKENGELSTENERLEGELKTAKESASADESTAKIEKLTKERDAAIKERDEAKAEATPEKIEAKALTLLSSAEAPEAVQKVIAARVTEELAQAGHPGPINNVEHKVGSAKTIKRSEFNALSHADRDEHLKAGGKIID